MINNDPIISADFVAANDISSLSNRPNTDDGLTAEALKARFDALVKKAIESINDIIDQLQDPDVAEGIPLNHISPDIDSLAKLGESIGNGRLSKLISVLDRAGDGESLQNVILNFEDAIGLFYNYFSDIGFEINDSAKYIELQFGYNVPDTITKSAIADLRAYALLSEVDDAIAKAISSVYKYKGSVSKYSNLPTSDLYVGDVYNVESAFEINGIHHPAGTNVVWDGTMWEVLTSLIDLSAFVARLTAAKVIYANDASGLPTGIPYSTSAEKFTMAQRDAGGRLSVTEGEVDGHAANVGQVREMINDTLGDVNDLLERLHFGG